MAFIAATKQRLKMQPAHHLRSHLTLASKPHHPTDLETQTTIITKLINDHHPTPTSPLPSTLHHHHFSPHLASSVLGRLFSAHTNALKALNFFLFCLHQPHFHPSPDSFEKTLHILSRMRYFTKAWELIHTIKSHHPHLLTLKSMTIFLSKIAKFRSFDETLEAFERMERDVFVGNRFGTDEFNVLIKAFCTMRNMKEARSVFVKMCPRFSPDAKTMNILLLGFKESGDVTSVELFYHEMVLRGFKPNPVTYNVRIDAYCKKGCFGDALRLFDEMERCNFAPSIETITTLIHGAGVVRNVSKARQLFDEIPLRKLKHDAGVYNAFMSSLIRCRDVESAIGVMDEMERKGIGHDGMTYHTMFLGLMKSKGVDGVCKLYEKMVERNFVPKTRTVVMLTKFFCENWYLDMGLNLWRYLVERGYCPHGHALDLLVTGLCSRGRVEEAFECSKQMLERGRYMSESGFRMLERFLNEAGEIDKLKMLDQMIKGLQMVLPPSRGHAKGILSSTDTN